MQCEVKKGSFGFNSGQIELQVFENRLHKTKTFPTCIGNNFQAI